MSSQAEAKHPFAATPKAGEKDVHPCRRSFGERYVFNDEWVIETFRSHILSKDQEQEYETALTLPNLPDMLFARNRVTIRHKLHDFEVSFLALDALKMVNSKENRVLVSNSAEWREARKENEFADKIVQPFDWTFTPSEYKGTLKVPSDSEEEAEAVATPTEESIDYEKLKVKEQILFYEDIILYEDELDDNGCSKLSVKIRAMPSGFFCLQRFYLRVDNTMIRVLDTRLYFDAEKSYILREYSERESNFKELEEVSVQTMLDQNEIVNHLNLKKLETDKLDFKKAPVRSDHVSTE